MITVGVTEFWLSDEEYPSRIVTSQHGADSFCTHVEVDPSRDGRPLFKVSGHYDMTLADARYDSDKRYDDLMRGRRPLRGES